MLNLIHIQANLSRKAEAGYQAWRNTEDYLGLNQWIVKKDGFGDSEDTLLLALVVRLKRQREIDEFAHWQWQAMYDCLTNEEKERIFPVMA